MVVIGAIGAIGSMTFQRATAANSQVVTRGTLYAEGSAALDRIVRKLQTTPMRAAATPAAPALAAFSSGSIVWDDQSALSYDAAARTISLRDVAAGDAAGDSPVLLGNVSAFTLQPLNESNADLFTLLGVSSLSATQAAAVRRVSVEITLTRDGQTATLRTRAFLRCTMVEAGT